MKCDTCCCKLLWLVTSFLWITRTLLMFINTCIFSIYRLYTWIIHIKTIIIICILTIFWIVKYYLIDTLIFIPRHSFVPSPSKPSLHLQTKWAGRLQHSALSTHNEASSGSWHSSMSTHVFPSPVYPSRQEQK